MAVSEEKIKGLGGKSKMARIFSVRNITIAVTIIAAAVGATVYVLSAKDNAPETTIDEVTVSRGNIMNTIEASGVIAPIERYEITSLEKGTVIASPYEEGSSVRAGDILYRIDDTDVNLRIQQSQNSLEKTQAQQNQTEESIRKLTITAPASGTLTDFNVNAGDQLGTNKIGEIVDNDNLKARIPFNISDFDKINVGDKATVTSAAYMTSISGTVSFKFNSAVSSSEGSSLHEVEITVNNPGALGTDISVGATVHTESGDVLSSGSGMLSIGGRTQIIPETAGKVEEVFVKDGQKVQKGDRIARLSSETLMNTRDMNNLSLKDSRLAIEQQMRSLEDFNITSPIDGVVITKNAKVGDNINSGSTREVLMVVADISKMVFDISVDEIDITTVSIGQDVLVDADALPDKVYYGRVSKIASEGVAANGVSTFTVEITVDEPGELKSGMNANANIIIESREDVLLLPVAAVTDLGMKNEDGTSRGYVFVKSDGTNPEMPEGAEGGRPDGMNRPEGAEGGRPEGMNRPEGAEGERPEGAEGELPDGEMPEGARRTRMPGVQAPEGYVMRMVTLGLSDNLNVEITSGLEEGEVVGQVTTITARTFQMPGGGGGQMRTTGPTGGGGAPRQGGGQQVVIRN